MAAGMDHHVPTTGRPEVTTEAHEDWARTTATCHHEPGQVRRLVKLARLRLVRSPLGASCA